MSGPLQIDFGHFRTNDRILTFVRFVTKILPWRNNVTMNAFPKAHLLTTNIFFQESRQPDDITNDSRKITMHVFTIGDAKIVKIASPNQQLTPPITNLSSTGIHEAPPTIQWTLPNTTRTPTIVNWTAPKQKKAPPTLKKTPPITKKTTTIVAETKTNCQMTAKMMKKKANLASARSIFAQKTAADAIRTDI